MLVFNTVCIANAIYDLMLYVTVHAKMGQKSANFFLELAM